MGEVVHTSKVRIVQHERPLREAFIEGFDTPLRFGVHGGIAAFYGVEPKEQIPATLDHIVAGVGG